MKSRFNILCVSVLAATVAMVACSGSADNQSGASADKIADAVAEEEQAQVPRFSADSAMAYLRRQVDFGPRVPGTAAHKACADWLAATLAEMGAGVTDNVVTDVHPVTGAPVQIRNIFAQFNPSAQSRVLVLAHYDTRPWADEDSDAANHNTPIDGANDGASGVAVALELARLVAAVPPAVGVDVLLVDMEDSGNHDNDDSWCIGSRYWATHLPYTQGIRPAYAILLDMVGGRDAVFGREYFSEANVPYINDKVWGAAARLGLSHRFPNEVKGAITDDHLSLLRVGIPAIDIIEIGHPQTGAFNPSWHTLDDNIDNIDPATLEAVGLVVTKVIYDEK